MKRPKARWAEQARAYMDRVAANPGSVAVRPAYAVASPQPSNGSGFVQMCTVQDLPPSIAAPLTALQRDMLWAAWHGELRGDGHGVSIASRRASIVTLRALRLRGLVEKGGGQIGITQDGLIALELLYTDPREWATPIEAVTHSLAG
jgi:hypothetical protein